MAAAVLCATLAAWLVLAQRARSSAFGASKTKGLIPPRFRADIALILEKDGLKTGVEIGVQRAIFSESLLKRWPSCTRFYLVDPWGHQGGNQNYIDSANVEQSEQEKRYQEARKRLEPWQDKTVFMRNFSTVAAERIPDDSLDFVYVDARATGTGPVCCMGRSSVGHSLPTTCTHSPRSCRRWICRCLWWRNLPRPTTGCGNSNLNNNYYEVYEHSSSS